MKINFSIIVAVLALMLGVAVTKASKVFIDELSDVLLEQENSDDSGEAVRRDRRSSLMAHILYDELRQKLRSEKAHFASNAAASSSARRAASASVMMRRRASTPQRELVWENRYPNEDSINANDDSEGDAEDLSRNLIKRSLMAMILKDTLKQRLEDEKQSGRHRDIVWGKTTRSTSAAGSNGKAGKPHVIQLSPQLTETLTDIAEHDLSSGQQLINNNALIKDDSAPIAVVIRPKAGRSALVL